MPQPIPRVSVYQGWWVVPVTYIFEKLLEVVLEVLRLRVALLGRTF